VIRIGAGNLPSATKRSNDDLLRLVRSHTDLGLSNLTSIAASKVEMTALETMQIMRLLNRVISGEKISGQLGHQFGPHAPSSAHITGGPAQSDDGGDKRAPCRQALHQ
jgi:hypothetical protein